MNTSKLLKFLSTTALVVGFSTLAHAQATRTWVSGVGDDVNPCSRTAPCKTFAGAISKTAKDGEISVLDPGGYGAVTITKSITLNGTPGAGYGSILNSGGVAGVTINVTDPADIRKTVRLNWLDINGASTGLHGVRILAGSVVSVDYCNIDGDTGNGILDARTTGGKLFVTNTNIRNTAGSGIQVATAGTAINVSIDNVRSENSGVAGLTVNNGHKAMVSNSVLSGNAFGLDVEGTAQANVNNSSISGNTTGILTAGGGTLRLSNSDVAFNGTGISGTVNSFTNNRFSSNGAGGTITPIAPAGTNPSGQQ
jgi:Right handed beta helix region